MSVYVLKDCKLYLAGYNLSGDMNSLSLSYEAEMLDRTTFASGGSREKLAGLLNVTADHEGYWEGGIDKVDEVLFNEIGTSHEVMTICPTDGVAGEKAFTTKTLLATYSPGGAVGEMLAFTVSAEGHDTLVQGTIMINGALTATGSGTARQLGAVSATQKLYASMHVVAVSGTTPSLTLKVQSDDASGFLSPTDRITFAAATAIGSQWATPVAGPISDSWWRLDYTITGTSPSFTVICVVGIQ